MSSRKYLCEFRDQCLEFNKMNIICRDKPWICGYWKIYVENVRKRIKPIIKTGNISNIMVRPISREDS